MSEVRENSPQDIVNRYREPIEGLMKYLPWLKEHIQKDVGQKYGGSQMENTIPVPTYDSNLLSFVKAAQATGIMDRNYIYAYRRHKLPTYKDELEFIDQAEIMQMDDLARILSKYILEGNVKGIVWTEGVRNGVFERVVSKMHDLIHHWDHEN